MKTSSTLIKKLGFFIAFMIVSLTFNNVYAQSERIVKGTISDENGPLESTSVVLKGTKTGIATNNKGEFTFPTALKVGDILLISHLGYETLEVVIKEDTTVLKLVLTNDLLEFMGAVNTDKPYKSKRSK